jgi:hypothetical protein
MHGGVKCVTNLIRKSEVKTAVRSRKLRCEVSIKMDFKYGVGWGAVYLIHLAQDSNER